MTIEQSWASHNTAATTWLCFQTQTLLIIALYSLWLLYKKDIESLTFFVFFLITDDPLRWRLVVVAKLKNLSRAQLCYWVTRRAVYRWWWWLYPHPSTRWISTSTSRCPQLHKLNYYDQKFSINSLQSFLPEIGV